MLAGALTGGPAEGLTGLENDVAMDKTRVLLTGAAGTVGRAVLRELLAHDDAFEITVFEHDTPEVRKRMAGVSDRITLVLGDIAEPADIARVCRDQDAVIHLAAMIPPVADEKPEAARRVNVDGTAGLIRALEEKSPDAFLIYASSISVYGDRVADPEIRVGDPLVPSEGDAYAVTKIEAEDLVRASALDWTIFRLAAIMGGHTVSPLMFHMPLETTLEIATPGDVARAFVAAIDKREALAGRIFNLGGGPTCRIRYDAFLDRSFASLGMAGLRFPEGAFARRNFHCGAYADGHELNDILGFQTETLEDHFAEFARSRPRSQKRLATILRPLIGAWLSRRSEPLRAWRGKGPGYERYFGPRP